MPRPILTRRQRELLTLVRDTTPCPTFRELGDKMGIKSINQIAEIIEALEEKHFLDRGEMYKSRQLSLTRAGKVALTRAERETAGKETAGKEDAGVESAAEESP